jgi:hypothetical protein
VLTFCQKEKMHDMVFFPEEEEEVMGMFAYFSGRLNLG